MYSKGANSFKSLPAKMILVSLDSARREQSIGTNIRVTRSDIEILTFWAPPSRRLLYRIKNQDYGVPS